ncbi:F0F1 ATP synthase subunit A [Winogradskyella immobilis]|uniref:ATP synthase subunit a n=1 Tax=Winogradskyella immobilis TaxID=2816852 RepID=A0ABS8EJY7_9FLAO|nr:F0F1 ATP synthase subunit A [Winogradskyella immobilis]MCC1483520.1 F0F1 ATP synthase subunit A [Winogradskyella immobilis]MCG0015614.1 F0F1 ATP synthase subunit A [Winogradskyella immobilis]
MKINTLKNIVLSTLFIAVFNISFASETKDGGDDKKFDPKDMIMHHVQDAHGFHLWDWNGHAVSLSLPIILWTDNGLTTFMSSAFHHDDSGKEVVERNGAKFVKLHGKIYQLNEGANTVAFDDKHHATNASKPIDISITRNVFMMWVSVFVLFLVFITAARSYKKSENNVPTGIASFIEPLVVFVRDDIGIPMIGEKRYKRYMPYLLTVFFFIWINNIFGLIPILNGANLSGNIAFTFTLALFTFIITTFSGNKNYWQHIFWMPGVPVPMKIFLMPIEIIGIFTKPISLMIRLFANITAGHIIILALMSLIFIFKSIGIAPVSVAFSLFITVIEIVVTAIQAYIFTILSALYFGMATEEAHH